MRVIELELTPPALACMRAADIVFVDELVAAPANELIERGVGPHELCEVVARLAERDLCLPPVRGARRRRVPTTRDLEMFRLRVIDGLTLIEAGERIGVSRARVRQLTVERFGLRGTTPTASSRRWAATQRRLMQREEPSPRLTLSQLRQVQR